MQVPRSGRIEVTHVKVTVAYSEVALQSHGAYNHRSQDSHHDHGERVQIAHCLLY